MSSSYKEAGVDIKAGEETVDRIKSLVKKTFTPNVLTGIGHFGAFYQLEIGKYKNPVMVSSVDGVGTKLKVAVMMDKHNTVGQDLVNHCINDIAVCGATPLYFLDYLAFGKLNPDIAEKIIEGFATACEENSVSLIGGETAEMPGMYTEEDYDMSGTIVGIVEKDEIINGEKIKPGNVLVGFKSTGLHTNGYSLARKVLFEKYSVNDKPEGLTKSIGEELLHVHKSYLPLITKIKKHVNGLSHITGGGIEGNTNRIMPEGLTLNVDWKSWEIPAIFKLIQKTGSINDEEMRKAFNIGIGLIAVVDKENVDSVTKLAKELNEESIIIGEVK